MTHQVTVATVVPALIVMALTGSLAFLFTKKRLETKVNALDWLIALFGSVSLLGFVQVIKYYLHDSTFLFVPDQIYPRALDIVTILNLVTILILYGMVESFLAERPNPIRLTLLSVMITLFFSIALYFKVSGEILHTTEVLSFADSNSQFDEFLFDLIQTSVLLLVLYTFYMQYRMSDNSTVQRYLIILLAAIALFTVTAFMELLEHFIAIPEISAFLYSIPTFLILAWFYLRNSNFIYLAPANIAFLQIVRADGTLLYAAELTDELRTTDFLVAPSLTSISTIISELVNSESKQLELRQFVYNGGYILFEQEGELQAILQTDRPSHILKRSMRYFLREFNRLYGKQLDNYAGYIKPSDEGISPDTLFAQAIPIVMSKQMTSSFQKQKE